MAVFSVDCGGGCRGTQPSANPFPEGTDRFCRLPLPTLYYRPEATNQGAIGVSRGGQSTPRATYVLIKAHLGRSLGEPLFCTFEVNRKLAQTNRLIGMQQKVCKGIYMQELENPSEDVQRSQEDSSPPQFSETFICGLVFICLRFDQSLPTLFGFRFPSNFEAEIEENQLRAGVMAAPGCVGFPSFARTQLTPSSPSAFGGEALRFVGSKESLEAFFFCGGFEVKPQRSNWPFLDCG